MPDYIRQLIAEGEHQRLDFKFEVSDFRKIARTLVAFSNTDGGRLLIGVKDNGSVAGVRSEEEFFMLDGAARLYCKPEVPMKIKEWTVDGKKVLEVVIQPLVIKPALVREESDGWVAYIRQGDQNFRADKVQVKVWKNMRSGAGITIRYREAERALLNYIERHGAVTTRQLQRIAGLSEEQAENILVNFVLLGIIRISYGEARVFFRLADNYEDIFRQYETSII